ncbi:MAG: VOC family protein, partial [Sporichthyaceae bacterium]
MTDTTASKLALDLIILDCPDAMVLARFYSELLGWPTESGSDSRWATLTPPGGGVSPDNP